MPKDKPEEDKPIIPKEKMKAIGIGVGVAVGTAVGAVGAVALAPVALTAMGFTGAGIAAGSFAASMMSAAAVANGGGVAAGSVVAVLQSAGAVGLSAGATAGVAGAGGTVGAALVGAGAWLQGVFGKKTDKKPPNDDDQAGSDPKPPDDDQAGSDPKPPNNDDAKSVSKLPIECHDGGDPTDHSKKRPKKHAVEAFTDITDENSEEELKMSAFSSEIETARGTGTTPFK